jgi:signal transduction histidine kinase
LEYDADMERYRQFARRYGFDALIVAAAVGSALEVALRHDSLRAPRTPLWFSVPAIVLVVLLLLLRHRLPFVAPAAVWVLAAGLSFVDGRLVVFGTGAYVAGMAASLLLGALADRVEARVGLAVVVAGAATVVYNDPNHAAASLVFSPMLFAIVWLGGFALRERALRVEEAEERALQAEWEREITARIAVAEERARIARELHDVVAHAVSVMVLQVGAVRHRLPAALSEDREALQGVERAGRTALTEMRRLLGAMRGDDEEAELSPQPGLDRLDSLLDAVRRAGLPVLLQVEGEAFPLPRGVDLSAYRIVQEGLTNALKHAGADQAEVTLRYFPDELTIEVRDDGKVAPASDGDGHGLLGVRERVKIYGGETMAGRAPEGGFVLRTRLPLAGGGS